MLLALSTISAAVTATATATIAASAVSTPTTAATALPTGTAHARSPAAATAALSLALALTLPLSGEGVRTDITKRCFHRIGLLGTPRAFVAPIPTVITPFWSLRTISRSLSKAGR